MFILNSPVNIDRKSAMLLKEMSQPKWHNKIPEGLPEPAHEFWLNFQKDQNVNYADIILELLLEMVGEKVNWCLLINPVGMVYR